MEHPRSAPSLEQQYYQRHLLSRLRASAHTPPAPSPTPKPDPSASGSYPHTGLRVPDSSSNVDLYFTINTSPSIYASSSASALSSPDQRGRRLTLQIPPSVWPVDDSLREVESAVDSKSISFCSASSSSFISPHPEAISLIARMNRRHSSESPAPSLGSAFSSDDAASHGSCPSTPQIGNATAVSMDEIGVPQLNAAAQTMLARLNVAVDDEAADDGSYTSESDYISESECFLEEICTTPTVAESHSTGPNQIRIPSPGRFTGSTQGDSRSAWRYSRASIEEPNTSCAMTFYGVPWDVNPNASNSSSIIVEQVVETTVEPDNSITPGPPTSRRITAAGSSSFDMDKRLPSPPPSARRIPAADSNNNTLSSANPSLGPPIQLFDRSGALMADGDHWLHAPEDFEAKPKKREPTRVPYENSMGINQFYGFVTPISPNQPQPNPLMGNGVGCSEYDPRYNASISQSKGRNIDRTSSWLLSQQSDDEAEDDVPTVVDRPARPHSFLFESSSLTLEINTDVFAPLDEEILVVDKNDANITPSGAPKLQAFISNPKSALPPVIFPCNNNKGCPISPSSLRAPALPTILESSELSPTSIPFPAPAEHVRDPLFFQGFKHLREVNGLTAPSTAPDSTGALIPAPASALVYGQIRNEAMRMSRTCLPNKHRDMLAGIFSLAESAIDKKRFSPIRGRDESDDDFKNRMVIARAEKERRVMDQLGPIIWVLDAIKTLHGGNLLTSPAKDDLLASLSRWNDSNAEPAAETVDDAANTSMKKENVRTVLDLGGRSTGDWSWEIALQYPNARVFTVSVDSSPASNDDIDDPDQLCGPLNHIEIKAPNLWTLPFPSNTIDVISARSLYTILKTSSPANRTGDGTAPQTFKDEYKRTLSEIYRVLKPGGFFEFSLLDADILGGGDRVQELSVSFCNKLKNLDYDPVPTKNFIGRLGDAGFNDVHRTWMILPMCGVGCPNTGDSAEVRLSKYLKFKEESRASDRLVDLDASAPAKTVVQKIRSLGKMKDHTRNSSGKWNPRTASLANNAAVSNHQPSGSLWSILSNKSLQSAVRSPPTTRVTSSDGPASHSPTREKNDRRPSAASLSSPVLPSPDVVTLDSKTRADSFSSNHTTDASPVTPPTQRGPSTTASASYMTGMVGAWAWEQWMLRLHNEIGMGYANDGVLLRQIAEALDEGAQTGAAWRYITGWARKDL